MTKIFLKTADTDFFAKLVLDVGAQSWRDGITPSDYDFASRSPATARSASIFGADGDIVGTFWSYMHDGVPNAEYVAWMGRNAQDLMSGRSGPDTVAEGLRLAAGLAYTDWWPGPTPFYLRGAHAEAVTLRTNSHSEELATFWGGRAPGAAEVAALLVNAGPDILANTAGCRPVIEAIMPTIGRGAAADFSEDVADEMVAAVSGFADERVPVARSLLVLRQTASSAYQSGRGRCLVTGSDIRAVVERWRKAAA
jgi:hypothetical protein